MTDLNGPPNAAENDAEGTPENEPDLDATRIRPLPSQATAAPEADPETRADPEADPEATRIRPLPTPPAADAETRAEPEVDPEEVDPEATRIRPLPRPASPDEEPTRVTPLPSPVTEANDAQATAAAFASIPTPTPTPTPTADPDHEPTRVTALPPTADPDQQATRVTPLPSTPTPGPAPEAAPEPTLTSEPAPTLRFAPGTPASSADSLGESSAASPTAPSTDSLADSSADEPDRPDATKLLAVPSAEPLAESSGDSPAEPPTAVQPLGPEYQGPEYQGPDQAAPFHGSVPAPAAAPNAKRKYAIPTPVLYSLLLVVGLVGGIGAGWAVQHNRKPTPLPPLSVAQPKYPQGPLFVGQPQVLLPTAQDDASIAEGDLPSVLLPTPSGATAVPEEDHIWETLADAAENCDSQSGCLNTELTDGVDRIAQTAWSLTGGDLVQISITEYFPGQSGQANTEFGQDKDGGEDSTLLPSPTGSGAEGYSYVNSDNSGTTQYMVALHGNLLIEFLVWSNSAPAPDPSYIDGLVTQQLARL